MEQKMKSKYKPYSGSIKFNISLFIIVTLLSVQLNFGAIPLWDGIVWVYLGDSITEAHKYNQYMEAYFHLRYPKLRLHFRESGLSGATQVGALNMFEYWVYPWEPDVVSIMFGHNGNFPPLQYKEGILELCDTITKVSGAIPILISPQPPYKSNNHPLFEEYSDSLASLSRDSGWAFADEWRHLDSLWDANANASNPIDLQHPDPCHPGPSGHLCMAYSILTRLDTIMIISKMDTIRERSTDIVTSATIDASAGALTTSTKCLVTNVTKTSEGVTFTRIDERLPMPFDEVDQGNARVAIDLIPGILDSLNRYMLTVTGLQTGSYDINIDGIKSATVTAQTLASGWNMAEMTTGPIYDQLMNVLDKIRDKEGLSHDDLYMLSPYKGNSRYKYKSREWYVDDGETRDVLKDHLSQPGEAISEVIGLDNAIYNAAQPVPRVFEIYKAKNNKPTVNAGSDQLVFFGESVSIAGAVNDDGLPNPPGVVATLWEKVSGAGTVKFSSPSNQITKVEFSDTGIYVLRFVGNDSEISDTDEVSITITQRDTVAPVVTITSPNNEDTIPAGEDAFIIWTSSDNMADVDSCVVFLSTDNMTTWSIIGTGNIVVGEYIWSWLPPQINADSCWVKVDVFDVLRNRGSDTCDVPFTISNSVGVIFQDFVISSKLSISVSHSGTDAVFNVNLPYKGKMDIWVYNVHGRLLWSHRSTKERSGQYRVRWDRSSALNTGVRLVRVVTEGGDAVKKITLVR